MSYEKVCERCRRVCFSTEEFANHECFDMDDKINAEIAVCEYEREYQDARRLSDLEHQAGCNDL